MKFPTVSAGDIVLYHRGDGGGGWCPFLVTQVHVHAVPLWDHKGLPVKGSDGRQLTSPEPYALAGIAFLKDRHAVNLTGKDVVYWEEDEAVLDLNLREALRNDDRKGLFRLTPAGQREAILESEIAKLKKEVGVVA